MSKIQQGIRVQHALLYRYDLHGSYKQNKPAVIVDGRLVDSYSEIKYRYCYDNGQIRL